LPNPKYSVSVTKNIPVPVRDGAKLAGCLIRPDAEGKFPAIVEYNPYRKDDAPYTREMRRDEYYFAEKGYVMLRVDVRGTGSSEGASTEMYHLPEEIQDGCDVVEWIAGQPWCDGNVGMWGSSYPGNMSLIVAAQNPPHLKAIIPMHCPDDNYLAQYRGGCLRPFLFANYGPWMTARNFAPPSPHICRENWIRIWNYHLDNNVPWTLSFLQNHTAGAFWRSRSLSPNYDRIKCPTFIIDGWHDWHASAALRMFSKIKAPKRVLIGPWSHFGGRGSGPPPDFAVPGPGVDYLRECAKWFDYWLKGIETGVLKEPPVTIFVRRYTKPASFQRIENGSYRHESEWPVARAKATPFYLHPKNLLHIEPYTSTKSERDEYEYNPTVGFMSEPRAGQSEFRTPLDQRLDEAYSLVFTTEPLEQSIEVTGEPHAVLYVSSSADIALFVVKLCDVASDGTSALVTHGKLNATHRTSHEELSPLTPGEVYELQIDMKATSYVFEKGHRIRVDISSADIPDAWPTPKLCTNSIYRGSSHPSRIVLPVVPEQKPRLPEPDLLVSTGTPFTEAEWKSLLDRPEYTVTHDFINGICTIATKKSGRERIDDQTQIVTKDVLSMTIPTASPENTFVKAVAEYTIVVPEAEIKLVAQAITTGNSTTYHNLTDVEATIDGKRHFTKRWNITVPRRLS